MRAWKIFQHGGPGELKRIEVEERKPGPREARVQVRAVGLNHLDLWVCQGVPGHSCPLPLILGSDVAGVVESLGPLSDREGKALEKRGIRVGTRVVIDPMLSCGACESCGEGFPPTCSSFGLLGEIRDGGCADFLSVGTENLIALPDSFDFRQAVCLPIPYITAWSMLIRKARLQAGELVLIQAGGSGVSVAAIQIAKLMGAVVITTVGSEEKAAKAQAQGADYVINYRTDQTGRTGSADRAGAIREKVREFARQWGKAGVDVVIDHVGKDTWTESLRCLAWGGRIVTCGATTGGEINLDLKLLFFKNLSMLGATMGGRADLPKIMTLVAQGRLRGVVDSVFPMEGLPEAMNRLETRQVFGKVVVENGASH